VKFRVISWIVFIRRFGTFMKRRTFLFLSALGALGSGCSRAMTQTRIRKQTVPHNPARGDLRLWYRQPAANWNEALPIGNGRLAAMVFGGPQSEQIQLNEDTIWAGEKRDRINPGGAANLAEVRRLLFAGKLVQLPDFAGAARWELI
jgi:alpha-L-fucosidase 2